VVTLEGVASFVFSWKVSTLSLARDRRFAFQSKEPSETLSFGTDSDTSPRFSCQQRFVLGRFEPAHETNLKERHGMNRHTIEVAENPSSTRELLDDITAACCVASHLMFLTYDDL
jgi:hypothetical protein